MEIAKIRGLGVWGAGDTAGCEEALRAAGFSRVNWAPGCTHVTSSARVARRLAEFVVPEDRERLERDAADEEAVEALPILRPADAEPDALVADLSLRGRNIYARFPRRDEAFRRVVRDAGLIWNETDWQRVIEVRMGKPADRLAELAQLLLEADFPCRVRHLDAHAKAISGEYEEEHTRWVLTRGWQIPEFPDAKPFFRVTWARADDMWHVARTLPGARYYPGEGIQVPPEAYEAVLDFAGEHGFELDDQAKALVEHARAQALRAVTVDYKPGAAKARKARAAAARKAKAAAGGVANDLRDD